MRTLPRAWQAQKNKAKKVYFPEIRIRVFAESFDRDKVDHALRHINEQFPWTNTMIHDQLVGTGPATQQDVKQGLIPRFWEHTEVCTFVCALEPPNLFFSVPAMIPLRRSQLIAYENFAANIGVKLKDARIEGVQLEAVQVKVHYHRYCGGY